MNGIFLLHAGLALGFDAVSIKDGLIADVGDTLGSAKVVRIESHPEFERYWLVDDKNRGFAAEITRADGVHQGLCETHGLVLYPRAELVEGEPAPITVEPWCAVLASLRADQARMGERSNADGAGDLPTAVLGIADLLSGRASVFLCGLGALVSLAWFVRRDLIRFVLVVLAALTVRLWVAEPMLWNGGGAGYEKLLLAWGQMRGAPYGAGFAAWMGPAVHAWGTTFAAVSWTNVWFSALTAGIMYRIAVLMAPVGLSPRERKWFPRWVAVLATIFPVAVFLSRTELMHISAVAFGALAVLFAVEARNGSALAAVSALAAGFAAFSTRPDLGMVVLPVAAFALTRRSIWIVAVAVVAVLLGAWRMEQPDLLQPERLLQPGTLWSALRPHMVMSELGSSFQLFLHAAFTPAAWWAVALLGAFVARPALRWPALMWAAAATPFVAKVAPLADAVRLQLFAQYGWILLVAVGLARIGPRWALVVGVGAGLFQLSTLPLRWANHDEFDFLTEVVPTLPADTVVYSKVFAHRNAGFSRVMASLGPARWKTEDEAFESAPPSGALVYRSVGEPLPAGPAVLTRELPQRSDVDVQLIEPPVVGFYRIP